MIGTRGGREAGVHLRINLLYFVYCDVTWQNSVQTIYQLVEFHRNLSFEMSRHVAGMYSCVGSSGSHYFYLFSQKYGECTLDRKSVV